MRTAPFAVLALTTLSFVNAAEFLAPKGLQTLDETNINI